MILERERIAPFLRRFLYAATPAAAADALGLPLAVNSTLTALTKLVPTANKLAYFTGPGTAALADFSSGSFTPVLTFGGGSSGMAISVAGSYRKIGNWVRVYISWTLAAKGTSTGNAVISGLPFSAASGRNTPCEMYLTNAATIAGQHLQPIVSAGTSTILLRYLNGTSFANMTDAFFTNTTIGYLTVEYEAA